MLQQPTTLPYLLIPQSMIIHITIHKAIYATYYITTFIDTAIYMQQPKQQAMIWYSEYQTYRVIIHEQGDRSPAAGGPPPMRTPGAARRTPSQLSKTMNFVLLYCVFSVLPFVLSISASPKTHKPRGRASDVSTISTCFSLCYNILPTPPLISVRTAGGITVVYLCGL